MLTTPLAGSHGEEHVARAPELAVAPGRAGAAGVVVGAAHQGPRSVIGRLRSDPQLLGYVMGPLALVALLSLRYYHVVARAPVWLYISVFVAVPVVSAAVEVVFRRNPSEGNIHARIAVHAAAVTAVIYLSGWGPVLLAAYMIVAIDNVAACGARVWRRTLLWSLLGASIGQAGVFEGWVPSFVSVPEAEALGLMGAFVLVFVVRMIGATSERTEQAEASMRISEDRFRSLVQNSSDITLVLGERGVVIYASPATKGFLGREPEELVGHIGTEFVHPLDREHVEDELRARLADVGESEPVQFRMQHVDGTWRYAEAVVTDLRSRPSVGGYVANVRDITERKEAEALLAHRALHDPLTGLPNRVLLVDRLRQAMARGTRNDDPPPVVMFLDLDGFKLVNDSLGHAAGDELLVRVADRLRGVVRESDTLARFGGDEFVMLCEGIADSRGALALAERTRRAFGAPFPVHSEKLTVGVSIGIARVDGEDQSVETLLSDADFAMYLAKARSGKGRIQLFDHATRASARQRVHTETSLARAIGRNELRLHYQPIVEIGKGQPVAVEALLRWQHPSRGLLRPDSFLDVAEQTGLIVPIGIWVLSEACRQVHRWNSESPRDNRLALSVNLSGRQLIEPDFSERVAAALADAEVDPHVLSLSLEVTETLLPTDQEQARAHLLALHELGIELAIDDFGTGYSSLRYVRDLPISVVKIDRSFVSGLGTSDDDEAIVNAVVQLAHTLGLKVTAEGVETRAQVDFLIAAGCDYAQGYHFGRPAPADVYAPLVTSCA